MADAVIFDCDGVLIDSEAIFQRVMLESLAEIGLTYDKHIYAERFLGSRMEDFLGGLNDDHHRHHGRPMPEDLLPLWWDRADTAMDAALVAIAGVHDVVNALKMPKAIASGSSPDGLEKNLRKVALYDHFAPHIYSAQIVPRGKPAPDVYLHAAREIGVEAPRCVAVEDSVNGARAALAAGMTVIGFTGGSHCPPQHAARLKDAGVHFVIDHMDQLLTTIG